MATYDRDTVWTGGKNGGPLSAQELALHVIERDGFVHSGTNWSLLPAKIDLNTVKALAKQGKVDLWTWTTVQRSGTSNRSNKWVRVSNWAAYPVGGKPALAGGVLDLALFGSEA